MTVKTGIEAWCDNCNKYEQAKSAEDLCLNKGWIFGTGAAYDMCFCSIRCINEYYYNNEEKRKNEEK